MPASDLELRRRRALFRATHRGSKELDFLVGRFAAASIAQMTGTELETFERLIDTPDPDIAAAFYDGQSLGAPDLDQMMQRLRGFHGFAVAITC